MRSNTCTRPVTSASLAGCRTSLRALWQANAPRLRSSTVRAPLRPSASHLPHADRRRFMKRIALVLVTFLSLGTVAAFAQESGKTPAPSGAQMVNLNSATVPQLEDAAGHRAIHGRDDRRVPPEERRLQESRRPDERPGHRREELPEAQAARHRRDASGRAIEPVARPAAGGPGRGVACAGASVACCRRGPRAAPVTGYSLVECLFAVTLFGIIAAASVPPLAWRWSDRGRRRAATIPAQLA